jgi:hypothetical protein
MKVARTSGESLEIYPYKTSSPYSKELLSSEDKSDMSIKGNRKNLLFSPFNLIDYLANWINIGLTSDFRKFFGVIKEEIKDKTLKVKLTIERTKMADITGL